MIGETPCAAEAGEASPAKQPVPGDAATGDAQGREKPRPRESGGREGPEPTRYGDWEKNGRCIDF